MLATIALFNAHQGQVLQEGRVRDLVDIEQIYMQVQEVVTNGERCDIALRSAVAGPIVLVPNGNTNVGRFYSTAGHILLTAGANATPRLVLSQMFLREPPVPPSPTPPPGIIHYRWSTASATVLPTNYRTYGVELVLRFATAPGVVSNGGQFADRVIPLNVVVDPAPLPLTVRHCYQGFSYQQYCVALGGYMDPATQACDFLNFKTDCALSGALCPAWPAGLKCGAVTHTDYYLVGFTQDSQPICQCTRYCDN